MCLCFLKHSRLLESGTTGISGTLLMMIHQTVKIKVGDKMYYIRFEKHFPLAKQNLCFPPTPNLLIVQRLDSSTQFLLLSQIFHGVLLADWRQQQQPVMLRCMQRNLSCLSTFLWDSPCQHIVIISRMYRSKMYKLFSPGLWSSYCFYKLEEFWTSQMLGREAVPLGEQSGNHFGTVNYGTHAWGTPSLPAWANWSNLFPANVFSWSNFKLVIESKKINYSKQ